MRRRQGPKAGHLASGPVETEQSPAVFRWLGRLVEHGSRQWINAAFVILDMSTVFLSLMAAFRLIPPPPGSPTMTAGELKELALLASLFGFVIFERVGMYRHEPSLLRLIEIRKIAKGSLLLGTVLIVYAFYAGIPGTQQALIYSSFLVLFFMMIGRAAIFKSQEWLYTQRFHVRRAVIVGGDDTGRMLYKHINEAPQLGYWITGIYDDNVENLQVTARWLNQPCHRDGLHLIADEQALAKSLREDKVELLLISIPMGSVGEAKFKHLLTLTRGLPVTICFMPYFAGYYAWQVRLVDFNGFPMVSLGKNGVRANRVIGKRIIDLLAASCGLLMLAPAFALIAYAIRKDSPGPIFFSQERVGKDGRYFTMYKFRTMFTDAPRYGYTPTQSNDPRITRIGRFLRRTSLDELPQLFNVLIGNMSLVGPRPEMPFIVENEYDDFLRERLRVKPGITGVWQISADRNRQIHEDIAYDLFYIENQSLLLDLIILVRTVLFGVGAMRTF